MTDNEGVLMSLLGFLALVLTIALLAMIVAVSDMWEKGYRFACINDASIVMAAGHTSLAETLKKGRCE